MTHHRHMFHAIGTITLVSALAFGLQSASAHAGPLAGIVHAGATTAPITAARADHQPGEAHLWLVGELGGDEGAGNDGGDSFRHIPPRGKTRKKMNFGGKSMALQVAPPPRKKKPQNVSSRDFRNIHNLMNPNMVTLNPIQRSGRSLSGISRNTNGLPGNNPPAGASIAKGFSVIGTSRKSGKKSSSKSSNNITTSWTKVSLSGTPGSKGRKSTRGWTPPRLPFHQPNPRRGGGSRACTKFVTVVVNGTPTRVKVNAPGSC